MPVNDNGALEATGRALSTHTGQGAERWLPLVVAILAGLVILTYAVGAAIGLANGNVGFSDFKELLTAIGGLAAGFYVRHAGRR